MDQHDSHATEFELAQQLHAAESMCSTARRLGGLLTLLALGGWIWWMHYAANDMRNWLLINKVGMYASLMYAEEPGAEPLGLSEQEMAGMDLAAVKELLAERRAQAQAEKQTRAEQVQLKRAEFDRFDGAQNIIFASWIVIMVIVAAFMLGAGLAGLAGLAATRRWHRLVIYWTIIASCCTVAGVYALQRWGGFPEPNYPLIFQVAGAQCSYALLIAIALLATRKTPASGYAAY